MLKHYRYIVILIFQFSLIFLQCNYYEDSVDDSNRSKIIIAHRGASGLAPENTLAAIGKAMDLGSDMIEIDVHQTRDSVVVVIHDYSIDKTTNGQGMVKDLTFSEIRMYSAGEWFDEKYKGEKVPSLQEVLTFIRGQTRLLIEIKGGNSKYPGIVKRVVDLINEFNAEEWCVIQSFYSQVLPEVFHMDPSITLHRLVVSDNPFLPVYKDDKVHVGFVDNFEYIKVINMKKKYITKRIIDSYHKRGLSINAWTVNDSSEIVRLFDMGVDGVITNYPNYKIPK
jgi:glycerophosphoryl diester phosphodiesterase